MSREYAIPEGYVSDLGGRDFALPGGFLAGEPIVIPPVITTPPVFRSHGVISYSSAPGPQTTVPAPAGIVDGDTLIGLMFNANNGSRPGNPTPPTGFTQVSTYLTPGPSGFMGRVSVWKKIAAGESGGYVWGHDSGTPREILMLCYSGSNGTVNASSALNEDSPGTTTRTATGITTTVANCMVVELGYDWGDNSNETPPTDMTERYDGVITYAAEVVQATAGATGDKTNTCNSNPPNPRGAFLIALEPAPPASTGYPKVWTGSAWTKKPAKVWNGTTWAQKPVKVWTGSIWKVLS